MNLKNCNCTLCQNNQVTCKYFGIHENQELIRSLKGHCGECCSQSLKDALCDNESKYQE